MAPQAADHAFTSPLDHQSRRARATTTPTNPLVTGEVFEVVTIDSTFAKVQVLSYRYNLEHRFPTYWG
jgi:hypothetical protein